MLKKDRTAASRKVGKRKVYFFIRRKPGITLPDGSKVKLKSENGRTDLIGGYWDHLICSNLNQNEQAFRGGFSIFGFTKTASGWKILLKSAAGSMPLA